jgi:hypothetical protein
VVGVLRGAHDRLHEVQPCVDVAAEAHDPREVAGPDAEVVGQRACPPDRLGGQPTRRRGAACEQGAVHLAAEGECEEEPIAVAAAALDRRVQHRAGLLVTVAIGQGDRLEDQADIGPPFVARGLGVAARLDTEPPGRGVVAVHVDVGLDVEATAAGAVVADRGGDVQALP